MSRTYVIINSDEVSSVNFNEVEETSASTLRFSADKNKTFVKFNSDNTPSFLAGKTQYNHAEILQIVSSEEWYIREPHEQ